MPNWTSDFIPRFRLRGRRENGPRSRCRTKSH